MGPEQHGFWGLAVGTEQYDFWDWLGTSAWPWSQCTPHARLLSSACFVKCRPYPGSHCLLWVCRLRRRLQGAEWRAPNLQPVFPAGLLVVLDASALLGIQSADLTAVLSEVRRLKAEADQADAASCLWHVVAAQSDLVALQAAARAGNAAASGCWQVWQAWQSEAQHEGIARPLAGQEMSGSNNPGEVDVLPGGWQGPLKGGSMSWHLIAPDSCPCLCIAGACAGDPAPAVKHALKCAILVHRLRCRLTYLCSGNTGKCCGDSAQSGAPCSLPRPRDESCRGAATPCC